MTDRNQILKRSNHLTQGLDLLLGQFKDDDDLKAFLTPYLNQIQALEDALYTLFSERLLRNVEGVHLDQYGKLVGEPRGGLNDTEYRNFIKVRILSNFSMGEIPRILSILKGMSGASKATYQSVYPAGYQVTLNTPSSLSDEVSDRITDRAIEVTGSGIGVALIEADDTEAFGFEGSDGLGFNVGKLSRVII